MSQDRSDMSVPAAWTQIPCRPMLELLMHGACTSNGIDRPDGSERMLLASHALAAVQLLSLRSARKETIASFPMRAHR